MLPFLCFWTDLFQFDRIKCHSHAEQYQPMVSSYEALIRPLQFSSLVSFPPRAISWLINICKRWLKTTRWMRTEQRVREKTIHQPGYRVLIGGWRLRASVPPWKPYRVTYAAAFLPCFRYRWAIIMMYIVSTIYGIYYIKYRWDQCTQSWPFGAAYQLRCPHMYLVARVLKLFASILSSSKKYCAALNIFFKTLSAICKRPAKTPILITIINYE